jgi:hypothetical protein
MFTNTDPDAAHIRAFGPRVLAEARKREQTPKRKHGRFACRRNAVSNG